MPEREPKFLPDKQTGLERREAEEGPEVKYSAVAERLLEKLNDLNSPQAKETIAAFQLYEASNGTMEVRDVTPERITADVLDYLDQERQLEEANRDFEQRRGWYFETEEGYETLKRLATEVVGNPVGQNYDHVLEMTKTFGRIDEESRAYFEKRQAQAKQLLADKQKELNAFLDAAKQQDKFPSTAEIAKGLGLEGPENETIVNVITRVLYRELGTGEKTKKVDNVLSGVDVIHRTIGNIPAVIQERGWKNLKEISEKAKQEADRALDIDVFDPREVEHPKARGVEIGAKTILTLFQTIEKAETPEAVNYGHVADAIVTVIDGMKDKERFEVSDYNERQRIQHDITLLESLHEAVEYFAAVEKVHRIDEYTREK